MEDKQNKWVVPAMNTLFCPYVSAYRNGNVNIVFTVDSTQRIQETFKLEPSELMHGDLPVDSTMVFYHFPFDSRKTDPQLTIGPIIPLTSEDLREVKRTVQQRLEIEQDAQHRTKRFYFGLTAAHGGGYRFSLEAHDLTNNLARKIGYQKAFEVELKELNFLSGMQTAIDKFLRQMG